jgi:hypothetical protein
MTETSSLRLLTVVLFLGAVLHFVVGWRGQEGKALAFLDLWILVVLLILTFGIRTQMIRYTLPLYPAIAIVVAYFVLHVLVHLRWGKHLVILSGGIALALFVSHRDVLLSSNSDLRALGLAVQRYAEDSQSVVAFRITEPGLVFYCRRPVQWIWRPEELGPVVQQGSLLIVGKADLLSGLVVQQDITSRVLYQGATYTLMVLSQTPRSTASATASDRAGSIPLPARR